MKNNKFEVNRRSNRLYRIRKIIRENGACIICIRRLKGGIKNIKPIVKIDLDISDIISIFV